MVLSYRIYTQLISVFLFLFTIVNATASADDESESNPDLDPNPSNPNSNPQIDINLTLDDAISASPNTNFNVQGASCNLVKKISNSRSDAYISLYVDSISVLDQSVLATLKFPILIFKYTDIKNFTNLPIYSEYSTLYKSDKAQLYQDLIDFEANKFILKPSGNGNTEFNEHDIYNDYITLDNKTPEEEKKDGEPDNFDHIDIYFPIERSGLYCIYIAPPIDKSITDMSVPIQFQNSYGYLSYVFYLVYTQTKYIILISCVMFGYLLNYILQFKIDSQFNNMNSISLISRVLIFYTLLPFIFLNFLKLLTYYLQNSFSNYYILNWLANFTVFLDQAYQIVIRFFILLFSMGYGVIYYHNGNSKNYRMMPEKAISKAFTMLIINLVLLALFTFIDVNSFVSSPYKFQQPSSVGKGSNNYKFIAVFHSILSFVVGIYPFAWVILSVINYFKTKKIISKFPINSTANSNTSEKIMTAFKRSILVIFILPLVAGLLTGFYLVYSIVKSIPLPSNPNDKIEMENYQTQLIEASLSNSSNLLFIIWSQTLEYFLMIGLMYAIWIRDNTGIILDPNANDPIEYADASQYDITDDEEEDDEDDDDEEDDEDDFETAVDGDAVEQELIPQRN
ncbi:hypothetical protein DFJ63DRAFT_216851 [Scheffersomyces coipomensis]|uniref:uncharacterized protein n=1 Tax=Scheffersomyces coipomensis TaxID=1788519 RepID=UPI00315C59D7